MHEITIQQFRGGYAVVWYEDGKRRRHQLAARTRTEAEAEARDVFARHRPAGGGLTVRDLWEAYSKELAGRPAGESLEFRGRSVLPWFGALRPDQIRVEDCRGYIADRRKAGRKDNTIWSQMNSLRGCLNWSKKVGLIHQVPYLELPPRGIPRERFLTHAEIDRLLAAAATFHIHLAMMIMLTTAARVTAVLELTWDRVDLERRQINLRTGESGRKGRAIVPINDSLYDILLLAKSAAQSQYVVEWAAGPVKSIRTGFQSAVKKAGLNDVSPHVLRHTAAVHMAEAGVSMSEISQYLGHSDINVTASVYARYSPQHLRKAAAALEFGKR